MFIFWIYTNPWTHILVKMQSFLMLKGTVHVATTVLQTSFTSSGSQATLSPHESFTNWSMRRNTLYFSLKQYICYMTNFLTVPRLCVFPSFLFSFGVSSFYSFFHIYIFLLFYFLFCYSPHVVCFWHIEQASILVTSQRWLSYIHTCTSSHF